MKSVSLLKVEDSPALLWVILTNAEMVHSGISGVFVSKKIITQLLRGNHFTVTFCHPLLISIR